MEKGTVGDVRSQCALMDADEPVIVKLIDHMGEVHYFRASRCWPDTAMAPAGRAFYVEINVKDKADVR